MKIIILVILVFIVSLGYSQTNEYSKIDSIYMENITANVVITNIGKKTFPIEVMEFIKTQDIKLFNQIKNARSSVSLIINYSDYYAPLLNEDKVFSELNKNINSIIKAQLLKIKCYRKEKVDIYFLFINLISLFDMH